MIWAAILGLVAIALLPLVLAAARPPAPRGRREADIALYHAQLAELDREREAGRLDEAQHRAATVEVQRRLLAAPEEAARTATGTPPALVASLILIPAAALGLYLARGTPAMPSVTHAERSARAAQEDALIERLRTTLAPRDPREEAIWRGYVMLGNAERSRGRLDAAAAAWERALNARFDVGLALETATLEIERERHDAALAWLDRARAANPGGEVLLRLRFLTGLVHEQAGRPAEARRAWQAIVDDSPPDAPWRAMLERRMERLPP